MIRAAIINSFYQLIKRSKVLRVGLRLMGPCSI